MPLLSFIYPEALWLIILLVPLVVLARYAPHRLSPLHSWITSGLRASLILFLILSLAGTQLVMPVRNLTTIFVLDSSDSISPSARGRAELFIQESLRSKEPSDQSGIVVFGENALVERSPTLHATLGRVTSIPIATHTNIEKAIQLGLALFPAETQKRLVLLSDGGENSGHAQTAARLAAARNIPIDIVDLSSVVVGDEALVTSLDAPAYARDGQIVDLVTTIESTVEQNARVRIFADEKLLSDQYVHLAAGRNQFHYAATVEGQGFLRYRVRIEPDSDVRVQNNEATLLVQVQGPPTVLLIEGSAGDARNLHEALEAAGIAVVRIPPYTMPTSLADLSAYDATVLVNVPARALPADVFTTLPSYVYDLGKGLVMVGGTESYGVGGYDHTTIEDALPVHMEVRSHEERPNLAIVFLIDKSGSMDACHCSGSRTSMNEVVPVSDRKVDIAKEAVTQASALMTSQDTLSIVVFDDEAHQILPPTQDPDPITVSDAVTQIEPRGTTNVKTGLLKAEEVLNGVDARIKHVILLTDGWGESFDHNAIAGRMQDNGITLSVVAAGNQSADYLADLADRGGGRYYAAKNMREVPQIFLNETITIAGNYIIEEAFIPAISSDSTIMHGFDGNFPILYGYNGTSIKETARSILTTGETMPLLAEWNYGLGRTIAWTSDMKSKWGYNLVQWDNFSRFSAQLVERVLPTTYPSNVDADMRVEGTFTHIVAHVQDESGNAHEALEIEAHVIEGTSSIASTDDSETRQRVQLTQVAPGEYRAVLPNPVPGTYLVQLVGREQNRIVFQNMSGLVVPYSSEYYQNQSNPGLLDELRQLTHGRLITDHSDVFAHDLSSVTRARNISLALLWLALILLPFDIVLRRVLLRWSDLETFVSGVRTRLQRQPTAPAPSTAPDPVIVRLAQAKQRASQSGGGSSSATATSQPLSSLPPSSPLSSSIPSPSPHNASSPHTAPDDPLERLRQAKERARRRARGEDTFGKDEG